MSTAAFRNCSASGVYVGSRGGTRYAADRSGGKTPTGSCPRGSGDGTHRWCCEDEEETEWKDELQPFTISPLLLPNLASRVSSVQRRHPLATYVRVSYVEYFLNDAKSMTALDFARIIAEWND